jgi:hypothetical protein
MKVYTSTFAFAALVTLLLAATSASAAQILAIYTFEGASPAAFDDVSGQGLDPTTIGAATLNASGYEGQAASFAGSTPISIPLDINPAVNPTLTIGAWVRPTDLNNRGLFGHDNGGWDRGLDLMSSTWRTTGGSNHNSGIAGDVAAWQFVAIRYDGVGGQDVKLYVDTDTYTRTLTAGSGATNMVIGAYTVTGIHAFSGLVDNFFIFDDALTDAEVETIRLNGLSGINTVAGFAATPPQVSALSPANGAGAASASADLVATFDEDVKKGGGNILIREFAGDAIVHTIAVSSGAVTIAGPAVTINPPSDLSTGVQYYVEIANGAILDLTDDPFTGISGNATWNFTTGVALANGTAIGVDFGPTPPSDNFNNVSAHGNSTILPGGVTDTSGVGVVGVGFTVTAPNGWSNNDAASSTDLPGQPAIFNDSHLTDWIGEATGADLTLTFSGLNDAFSYELVIGSGFIANGTNVDTTWSADGQNATTDHGVGASAYVSFSGLSTDGAGNLVVSSTDAGDADITVVSALQLTAVDPAAAPPVINALSPSNGENAASASANLVATFNEDVKKGAGNILIREFVGDAIVHTIAVSSGTVSISGADVTINPPSDLATGTQYYVEIANGAILDLTDNAFAGISGNATWSFSTAAPLANGTVIGVDFGPTAPTPASNFNQVNTTVSVTIPSGSVTNSSGLIVGGVSFSVSTPGSWSNNDAASSGDLPGQPAAFDDTHLTDWIGEATGGADLTLTFSGLDDALTYDLVIGSGFINNGTNVDTTWTADGLSATTGHGVGANAYVTLSTLSTDGAGNLVISAADAGDSDITVVSALTLTATNNPEVSRPRLRYAGTQFGVGSDWRTDSLVKSLDVDGDYVLGTDGYYLIGNNQRTSQPSYVTSWSPPTSTFGGNGGYAAVDDPAVVPPGTATILSGTANPGGSNVLIFSFVLDASLPAHLRLGIMLDGLDNASLNPDAVYLQEIGGGAQQSPTVATTSATYNDKNPDWLFFDATGFAAGTQIGVYSSGGLNTLQVFAFDSPFRGTVIRFR